MMMKIRLLVFLAVAVLVFPVFASAQNAADSAELTRLLNEFLDGAGRNDAAIHDRFWADDLIYTRGVGQRIDKAELMKGVRSAPAAKPGEPTTVYSAEDVKIQQYGNAAVVAFRLVGTTTRINGERTVTNHLNTGTFVKRNGRWQAVAWQATAVSDPATRTEAGAQSSSAETPTAAKPSADGRVYKTGPRGGCYYENASGKKTYVKKELCN